jgi:hypothetical protein
MYFIHSFLIKRSTSVIIFYEKENKNEKKNNNNKRKNVLYSFIFNKKDDIGHNFLFETT